MPVCLLLVGMTNLEKRLFIEMLANELHPNWHIIGKTSGQG
jgi:hypothetical protein